MTCGSPYAIRRLHIDANSWPTRHHSTARDASTPPGAFPTRFHATARALTPSKEALDIPRSARAWCATEEHGLAGHVMLAVTGARPASGMGAWLPGLARPPRPGAITKVLYSTSFISYAIADPAGRPACAAAADILTQLCDFTLHLDGWESAIQTAASPIATADGS